MAPSLETPPTHLPCIGIGIRVTARAVICRAGERRSGNGARDRHAIAARPSKARPSGQRSDVERGSARQETNQPCHVADVIVEVNAAIGMVSRRRRTEPQPAIDRRQHIPRSGDRQSWHGPHGQRRRIGGADLTTQPLDRPIGRPEQPQRVAGIGQHEYRSRSDDGARAIERLPFTPASSDRADMDVEPKVEHRSGPQQRFRSLQIRPRQTARIDPAAGRVVPGRMRDLDAGKVAGFTRRHRPDMVARKAQPFERGGHLIGVRAVRGLQPQQSPGLSRDGMLVDRDGHLSMGIECGGTVEACMPRIVAMDHAVEQAGCVARSVIGELRAAFEDDAADAVSRQRPRRGTTGQAGADDDGMRRRRSIGRLARTLPFRVCLEARFEPCDQTAAVRRRRRAR